VPPPRYLFMFEGRTHITTEGMHVAWIREEHEYCPSDCTTGNPPLPPLS
jgi:hypothetical protein